MTTVLLVEDSVQLNKALTDLFTAWGHTVYSALSAYPAIVQAQTHPEIEVVITDWDLGPDSIDGGALIVQLEFLRLPDAAKFYVHSGLYREVPAGAGFIAKGDMDALQAALA